MDLLKKFNPEVLKSVKVENEKFPGVFICNLQDLEQWKNLEALEIVPMVPADANEDYFVAMDYFKVTLSSANNYEITSLYQKIRSKEPKRDVLSRFDIKTIVPSKIKTFAAFRSEANRLQGKFVPRNVTEIADDLSIFFY
ncbi:hypothetical protein B9Z55_022660 [Caenorhabditis nigoni]|uniref:DUF38 domain-containing protein n=1 Tax=Caenorhabditis nigoni TaxID=1611254 RepID=A0A2G5SLX5_9PELO|nr:hypothetical protein B9Z55_022660 [Caenorhabditis nigoni]